MNVSATLALAKQYTTPGGGSLQFNQKEFLAFCEALLAGGGTAAPTLSSPYEERHWDAEQQDWKPWQVSTEARYDTLHNEQDIEFRLTPPPQMVPTHESRIRGTRFGWMPISAATYQQQKSDRVFEVRPFTGYVADNPQAPH